MRQLPKSKASRTSDTASKLRELLLRLSATEHSVPGPATSLVGLIDLIAGETDETVLARRVAVIADDTEYATLTLSNRRLVGYSDASDPEGHGFADATDPARAAEHCISHLQTLFSNPDRQASLRRVGPGDGLAVTETSCSAEELRAAAARIGQENRLARILRRVQADATAWVYREAGGTPLQHDGPADLLDKLASLIERHPHGPGNRDAAVCRSALRPSCTFLPLRDQARVMLACDGEAVFVAFLEADQVAAIQSTWAKVYRSA